MPGLRGLGCKNLEAGAGGLRAAGARVFERLPLIIQMGSGPSTPGQMEEAQKSDAEKDQQESPAFMESTHKAARARPIDFPQF